MKKSENREYLCHRIVCLLSVLIVATTNGLLDGNIVILNTNVCIGVRTSLGAISVFILNILFIQ